jgi:hypothetical protein
MKMRRVGAIGARMNYWLWTTTIWMRAMDAGDICSLE